MNRELPDVQAGFRKGRGTRDQIAWIIEKARAFQKNIYFCFIYYTKAFDCGSQQTVGNSSRDGNTRPPYLPSEKSVCRYSHLLKNFPQFVVIHTVKGFSVVNKAEVDVFLELICFVDDPTDVGNLIYGCSTFSKSSLNIWKFIVHILLKPGLEYFEHYFTSM